MRRIFASPAVALSVSLMVLSASCDRDLGTGISSQRASSETCPALVNPSKIQVLLPPGAPFGKTAYLISEPASVQPLISFVSLRQDVSPPSADTPPTPHIRVMIWGERSTAVFGSGAGVFYFQCGNVKGTRYASAGELAEFEALIANPNQK